MKKWHVFLSFIVGLTLLASIPISASAADKPSNIQSFEPTSLVKSDGTYWVWGGNQSVPTQFHGMTDVETVFSNNFVMKKDGSIWYLERNQSLSSTQIHEVKGLSNISAFHPLGNELFAIDTDGKVYTAVHTDGTLDLTQFVQLSGIDNVTNISGYYEFIQREGELRSVFLKNDGTVWKDKNALQSFERIPSLNDITAIDKDFALKKDGTVWKWPWTRQFSEDAIPLDTTPTVISELRNIKKIKSNGNSNIAIDDQSRLWFWGVTITGSSDGTTYHEGKVPVLLNNIKDVRDAYIVERSLVVVTESGNVYETSIEGTSLPGNANFTLLTSDVSLIKQGYRSIIMQKNDGSLWGWGVNKDAQLGYGDYEFMHSTPVPVQKPISVHLNGESVALNNGVMIRNSQAFIPLRSVFEKLGAAITFEEMSKVVTIKRSNVGMPPLTISINYKSGEVTVNNEAIQLQNTPFSVNGTSYLPLRFISETLGAKVDWVQEADKISITMK